MLKYITNAQILTPHGWVENGTISFCDGRITSIKEGGIALSDKNDYLNAMQKSVADSSDIKRLLQSALTDKINDRETFMKGIDYSYYYEQEE